MACIQMRQYRAVIVGNGVQRIQTQIRGVVYIFLALVAGEEIPAGIVTEHVAHRPSVNSDPIARDAGLVPRKVRNYALGREPEHLVCHPVTRSARV
ncbi:Uncharacterised protein [Mycobacteroides abscessus subsp. abscessus]|nr:Uncharacterised protein [Mycobacteroides abscessus subsp. abscessus]